MVKIDGGKIRSLREQQGLTQLYLATAVEVTTDTISRWENRRYPTIKKENALKLAEVLEVGLEELLDTSEEEVVEEETSRTKESEDLDASTGEAPRLMPRKRPFGIIVMVCLLIVFSTWFLYSSYNDQHIEAFRLMPAHTAPGQPFPVVIKIESNDPKPSSFILREMLPSGAILVESQKSIPAAVDHKTGEMKWINKVKDKMVLGYSLRYDDSAEHKELTMKRTVTLRKFAGKGEAIAGNNRIVFAPFHWADTNKDNYIDDLEILAVYEDYSDATGLDLEMDLIEDIWFGSGYSWNGVQKRFEITP